MAAIKRTNGLLSNTRHIVPFVSSIHILAATKDRIVIDTISAYTAIVFGLSVMLRIFGPTTTTSTTSPTTSTTSSHRIAKITSSEYQKKYTIGLIYDLCLNIYTLDFYYRKPYLSVYIFFLY